MSKTAILLFSRTPREEARSKRIVSRHKTVAVTQILRVHSLRQARQTGLPVLVSTEADQLGQTFGQRLANAMESAFAQGYEQLLVIGNDSPDLRHTNLRSAAQKLNLQRLVIGPATDGGTYLIGLNRANYHRERFMDLAWETADLQTTFAAYAQSCELETHYLAPIGDIDNTQDFWSFFRSLSADSEWRTIFHSILSSNSANWLPTSTQLPALSCFLGAHSLRAPPVSGITII